MDFANAIRPISETYFVLYMKQVNNTKKAHLLEYRKVAIELREVFQNLSKTIPTMVKENTFNADYAGESEEDISIAAEVQKGRGNSSSRS